MIDLLAGWAGPFTPAAERFIAEALQPITMPTSASVTPMAQPLGPVWGAGRVP